MGKTCILVKKKRKDTVQRYILVCKKLDLHQENRIKFLLAQTLHKLARNMKTHQRLFFPLVSMYLFLVTKILLLTVLYRPSLVLCL